MAKNSVKKTKKRRKLTPFMKLVCVALLAISGWFMYSVGTEVIRTVRLRSELSQVQEQLAQIQKENEKLTDQKEKLEDPDYVESYARGNYMLTKEGEQIFYFPEKED